MNFKLSFVIDMGLLGNPTGGKTTKLTSEQYAAIKALYPGQSTINVKWV
jgi:hypothetical protein